MGAVTAFDRARRLLEAEEINRIGAEAPADLVRFQDVAAGVPIGERPALST